MKRNERAVHQRGTFATMPNTWSYDLTLDPVEYATAMSTLLSVAAQERFVPAVREHLVSLFNGRGEELHVRSEDVAQALITESGTISLRDDIDDHINVSAMPAWREVGFCVLHALREERETDVRIERKLDRLFREALSALDPVYAVAWDESSAESVAADVLGLYDAQRVAIRGRRAPPVLFWRNYFRRDYVNALRPDIFVSLGSAAIIEPLKNGTLISIGDRPWRAGFAALTSDSGTYASAATWVDSIG